MQDAPANGQVNPSGESFPVDTVLTYTCDDGYTLDGESETLCLEGGVWSNDAPACNGKFCYYWLLLLPVTRPYRSQL